MTRGARPEDHARSCSIYSSPPLASSFDLQPGHRHLPGKSETALPVNVHTTSPCRNLYARFTTVLLCPRTSLQNFTCRHIAVRLYWYTKLAAQKRQIMAYPMTGRSLTKHCV